MTERNFKAPEGREVGGLTFIKAKTLNDEGRLGEVLQGTFLEAVPNALNEGKLDYRFRIDSDTSGSESEIIVNGAGNLGYKMKFINPGDFCQVLYNGMKPITKGPQQGRNSHDFEVLTDQG